MGQTRCLRTTGPVGSPSLRPGGAPSRAVPRAPKDEAPSSASAARFPAPLRGTTVPGPPKGALEAGVDWFGFEGEDGEDGLVDAPEGFARREAVEGFEAQGVLAQGE